MAAKKQPVEMTGLLMPRERVWQAIRKITSSNPAQRFTVWDVQEHCAPMVIFMTVYDYMNSLEAAGYIRRIEGGELVAGAGNRRTKVIFKIDPQKRSFEAPRVHRGRASVQGMGVLAMWRAMKVLKSFDFRELASAASVPGCVVKERTAQLYLNALVHAGYMTELRAPTRQLAARYRLARDTGPHAPAVTRQHVVLDRNKAALKPLQTEQEVCDGLE